MLSFYTVKWEKTAWIWSFRLQVNENLEHKVTSNQRCYEVTGTVVGFMVLEINLPSFEYPATISYKNYFSFHY